MPVVMVDKKDSNLFGGAMEAPHIHETLPISITHRAVKDLVFRSSLSDSQIAEAQRLRGRGMIYREIGEILGVSYKIVSKALNPEVRKQIRLYGASYRKTHKKEKRLYNLAYNKTHKEEKRLHNEVYCKDHKEELSLYRKTHLPESAARQSARRAKINSSTAGDRAHIAKIYRVAAEEPKVRCYLCNKLIPFGDRHVDHILPISKGGLTRPSNLAVTCSHCNLSKASKHPNEFGLLI